MVSVAADIRMALDRVAFARAAGIEPDPWQARLLWSGAPRILLNCSRQSGKSLIVALLALHTAIYEPDSLVLCVSRAERQSVELLRKISSAYRALGRPVPSDAETVLRLELENGSRIVALPGKEETIRSYSGVRLLCIDEAARVPDVTYYSVRPMLAVSAGRLIALSTPFGDRGWWAGAWNGPEPWERYEVPASMCPRITPTFLAEERRTLGPWWFNQEYLCGFEAAQSSAFRREDVDAAVEAGRESAAWKL